MKNTWTGRITVWGDSLLKGVVLDDIAGRYRILKDNMVAQCARLLDLPILNRCHFGITSGKGKEIIINDLSKGKPCDLAVLEFGGNDCDYDWAKVAATPDAPHIPNTPLEEFEQNVQEMITLLKQQDIPILIPSLPPLHAQRYFDWITRNGLDRQSILQFLGDVQHIYRHHERYSLAITKVALQNNCHLVNIRDAFLQQKNYQDYICADGIHPNQKGHQLMRDTFVKKAQELLHAKSTHHQTSIKA